MDWTALGLTLRLAFCSMLLVAIIGIPLSYWLARSPRKWKWNIEAVVSLPMLLPPTVLGFYLLILLSPQSAVGKFIESTIGLRFPFTFAGLLVASLIFNLPFAVRPWVSAFRGVDQKLLETAYCLGFSPWKTFWNVTLPLSLHGILAGLVLTFIHTMGEFGVTLMLGGNMPGVTRTLSITIYDDVQAMRYEKAFITSLVLVGFAILAWLLVAYLQRRSAQR